MDEARQKLVADVEANKFDKDTLASLMGREQAERFFRLKMGGAYTPQAVVKAMGWDKEQE